MSKSKTVSTDDLRDDIRSTHKRMRDIAIAAGIPEQHYDKPLKDLENISEEALKELRDWLQDLYDGDYSGVLSIWNLKPAEWWFNMESLFSQRKTREQKLLKLERKKLRKAWYKRLGVPDDGSQEKQSEEPVEDTAGRSAT